MFIFGVLLLLPVKSFAWILKNIGHVDSIGPVGLQLSMTDFSGGPMRFYTLNTNEHHSLSGMTQYIKKWAKYCKDNVMEMRWRHQKIKKKLTYFYICRGAQKYHRRRNPGMRNIWNNWSCIAKNCPENSVSDGVQMSKLLSCLLPANVH